MTINNYTRKINKTIEILQAKPELTDKEQQILNNLIQQKEILENNTQLSELIKQVEEWWLLSNLKRTVKNTWDNLEWLAELIELWQDLGDLVWVAYNGLSGIVSSIWELLEWIIDFLSTLSDIFEGFS